MPQNRAMGRRHTRDLFQARSGPSSVRGKAGKPFRSGIVRGDVIRVLGDLSRYRKFDVVIADPPYNIGKDFGNNTDNMPLEAYVDWTSEWLRLCFNLLKPNGLIYVYGFPEILARVAVCYPVGQQRWLAWHYTNKTVPSSKFWQRSHESILCLWRPEMVRPQLMVDQIREPYTKHYLNCAGNERKSTACRYNGNGRQRRTTYVAHENGALPRDVIKVPALAGGAGRSERWFMCRTCGNRLFAPGELEHHRDHDILKHPTQKPMALTKRLILSRINGNKGRLLVPFAGSGSECVVAKALGIEYLGIEINPEYVSFARKWLKKKVQI